MVCFQLRRRGAARADVVVAAVVGSMLLTGLLAAQQAVDEKARRTQCASNLRQIGQAIQIYANENKGAFPRATYDMENADKVTAFSNWKGKDPFAKAGAPGPNDLTAGLFLLLRTGDISPDVFVCPSTDHVPLLFGADQEEGEAAEGEVDPVDAEAARAAEAAEKKAARGGKAAKPRKPAAASARDISNFPAAEHLSYSYTNAYPSKQAREAGFKLNYTLNSEFAIASDLNPGGAGVAGIAAKQMPPAAKGFTTTAPAAKAKPWKFTDAMKKANSPNHGGFGQNVLYADGHVTFQQTPFCGAQRPVADAPLDNIFTRELGGGGGGAAGAGGGGANTDPVVGPPMDPYDSVMLPVASPAAAKAGAAGKKGARNPR